MTIINPNSIAGITSFTAEADVMNFYRSNGTLGSLQLNGCNFNTTNGISTFNNLNVGGTLTYEDVKNVDSVGIISARTAIHVGAGISAVGIITGTSFRGDGSQLTGITQTTINNNADNRVITGSGTANTLEGEANLTFDGNVLRISNTNFSANASGDELVLGTTSNSRGITIASGNSSGNSGNIFFADSGSNTAGRISYEQDNDEFVFYTGTTERTRITASGVITKYDTRNVSIRNASGSTRGHLQSNGNGIDLQSWVASNGFITFSTDGGSGSANERVRIHSSGVLQIGDSTASSLSDRLLQIGKTDRSATYLELRSSTSGVVGLVLSDGTANNDTGYRGTIEYNHNSDAMFFKTAATERLRINSNGIALFGTTTQAPWTNRKLTVSDTTSGGTCAIEIRSATNGSGRLYFTDGTSGGADSYAAKVWYDHADDAMKFNTGGGSNTPAERLRIDSSGKIGIGQAPNTKVNAALSVFAATGDDDASDWGANGIFQLDHSGSAAANNEVLLLGAVSGGVGQIASGFGFGRESTSNWGTYISFKTHSTGTSNIDELKERVRIQSDGTLRFYNSIYGADNKPLYLGNSNDLSLFHDSGGASIIRYNHNVGGLHFRNNSNADKMVINSTGDVCIGATAPVSAEKLYVLNGSAISGRSIDPLTAVLFESAECRLQLQSDNTGNNASTIILSNDNKHWMIQQRATGKSNNFQIGYYAGTAGDLSNLSSYALQIKTNGVAQFSTTGSFDTYTTADNAYQFRHDFTNVTGVWISNTNSSHTKELLRLDSARSGSSSFYLANFTTGNLSDDQFLFRGDGSAYQDGGTTWSTPADYAEMFEWDDGNPNNEDRRGISVVLVGDKIRASTSSDDTSKIIGVISGNPAVTGDGGYTKWHLKYLLDDYNNYILDENGERKLNPDYDSTKTYVPREDRKEWSAVGMLGKLRVKVNQPVGSSWIKLKDISASIEQWLVR